MATPTEIPSAIIQHLQAMAREEAGVPWYDPSDPATRTFPTLREAVAGLDPSPAPAYLRCKRCDASLLRGVKSTVCVWCGAEQRRDAAVSMSFTSTLGYRRFLESLGLDGSEHVMLDVDSKESKTKGASKDGMVLSSLLDLELRWPPEGKEVETSTAKKVSVQDTSTTLNLSGVDLDNFFSEAKETAAPIAPNSAQEAFQEGKIILNEPSLSSNFASFDAFESNRSSDTVVNSVSKINDEYGGSFANWEAGFQSAGHVNPSSDSKSVDLFQNSSQSSASDKPIDKEHSPNTGHDDQPQPSDIGYLPNTTDDWVPDDIWPTADVGIPSASDQGNRSLSDTTEMITMNDKTGTATDDMRDGGSPKASIGVEKNDEDDDSFDIWQDFTSSQQLPEAPPNSVQTDSILTSSNKETGGLYQTGISDDMEFGGFLHSGSFSGASAVQSDSIEFNDLQFSVLESESSSWAQTGDMGPLSNEQASSMNLTDTSKDTEFGEFFQSASSSGTLAVQNGSKEFRNLQLETFDSDGTNSMEAKESFHSDIWIVDRKKDECPASAPPDASKSSIEALLSQMHDLSFMLESNLSIPNTFKSSESSS